MAPEPRRITNDIIDKLNSLDFDSPGIDFELARYKREVRKIIDSDPQEAYDILGAIACLELDVENVRKYHSNAVELSGNAPRRIFNYSSSLARLGLLDESILLCEQAYEKSKDLEFLTPLAGRLYFTGDILGAWGKVIEYNKISKSKHELTDEIGNIISLIPRNSKFYPEVKKIISSIYKCITDKGIIGYALIAKTTKSNDNGFFLNYDFNLPIENIDIKKITIEIEDILNNMPTSEETMSILCINIFDNELCELLSAVDDHIKTSCESSLRSPSFLEYDSILSLIKDVEIDQ